MKANFRLYFQQDFFRLWQGKRETGINKRETQWRQWIKVAIEQTRVEMRQERERKRLVRETRCAPHPSCWGPSAARRHWMRGLLHCFSNCLYCWLVGRFGSSLLIGLVPGAARASFGGIEARLLRLVRLRWFGPFYCVFDNAVRAIGEGDAPVVAVQGGGEASDVNGLPDPSTVPVGHSICQYYNGQISTNKSDCVVIA